MSRPSFFIVGAAVSGTTSLYHYLGQHLSIFTPRPKEVHFFSEYPPASAPKYRSVEEYLTHFDGCPEGDLACDGSTSYLYSGNAASRIHALWPDAKIIMILRNPIDRAYSLYWHNRRDFLEKEAFEDALDLEEQRIREEWSFGFHYVRSGLYHRQVERYLNSFGPDRVLVLLFEEFRADPARVCRRVFEFLRIDCHVDVRTDVTHNRTGYHASQTLGWLLSARYPGRRWLARVAPAPLRRLKDELVNRNLERPPAMDAGIRSTLAARFEEDVLRLEQLIGRDLRHWRSGYSGMQKTDPKASRGR